MNPSPIIRCACAVLKILSLLAALAIIGGFSYCLHEHLVLLGSLITSSLLILASLFGTRSPRSRIWLGVVAHAFAFVPSVIILWNWSMNDARQFVLPPAILLSLWWLFVYLVRTAKITAP